MMADKLGSAPQGALHACTIATPTTTMDERITSFTKTEKKEKTTKLDSGNILSTFTSCANITKEGLAFVSTYLRVRLRERHRPYQPLTTIGRFNHYICDPYFRWHGENDRILLTASIGRVGIRDLDGSMSVVVNGGSHNYVDNYTLSMEDEDLQQRCLDHLPVADAQSVPLLNDLMIPRLAEFWSAECCFASTTGYQANMIGIPGVAGPSWLIVVDDKSHNSIFTAAYVSRASVVKKFKHNDMKQLEGILEAAQGKFEDVLVVVEGLYSMDGTLPTLDALYDLKKRYKYVLYVDEAHSFGSIGRSGRGCLELWNELYPQATVPEDLIDVRSAVLSKAVGGLGGFVCGSRRFAGKLRLRTEQLSARGESLNTSTMLQTLGFMLQPKRLSARLHRLRDLSVFCHEELERQGVHIYGDKHMPMLPVFAGRPSKSAKLSYMLRKSGLVASPVSAPAVGLWESRVRITLSASYSDGDVNALVEAIVVASRATGLSRPNGVPPRLYKYLSKAIDDKEMDEEQLKAHELLADVIEQQIHQFSTKQSESSNSHGHHSSVIEAGHAARREYGLGSGSARWILGTFECHLRVESLVAKHVAQPSAMTYPCSDLGLMSTVAGLCRPIMGYPKHYFLVPTDLAPTAEEGLQVASKKCETVVVRYTDCAHLAQLLRKSTNTKDAYITLYFELKTSALAGSLIQTLAAPTVAHAGMTVLLNDTLGLWHRHGHLPCQRGGERPDSGAMMKLPARILVFGSFFREFSLPGGFLAGDDTLIEELRYTSRCYMFTTSPQPFVMAMIERTLLTLLPSGKGDEAVESTETFWMATNNPNPVMPLHISNKLVGLVLICVCILVWSSITMFDSRQRHYQEDQH